MDRRTATRPVSSQPSTQLTLLDSRFIRLGERFVEYRFARSPRRTLRITVDATGLAVTAPLRAPLRAVESFLREKERWILRKLEHWSRVPRPRLLRMESGALLPLRGAEIPLVLREAGRTSVHEDGGELIVRAPGPRRAAQALVRWLKLQALESLTPRAAHFAALLGFPAPRVGITSARGQWGVCVEGGRIRLNWRLVHLREALADYVVAHEVAHLAQMNHSPRFWSLVETLYPAWREAREQLELAGASIPRIVEAS